VSQEKQFIHHVNSFSSLTACYLVMLHKQFFSGNVNVYGRDGSAPLEKLACMPTKPASIPHEANLPHN